jgi:hypothetical protein
MNHRIKGFAWDFSSFCVRRREGVENPLSRTQTWIPLTLFLIFPPRPRSREKAFPWSFPARLRACEIYGRWGKRLRITGSAALTQTHSAFAPNTHKHTHTLCSIFTADKQYCWIIECARPPDPSLLDADFLYKCDAFLCEWCVRLHKLPFACWWRCSSEFPMLYK